MFMDASQGLLPYSMIPIPFVPQPYGHGLAHKILHFGCSLVRNLDGHIGQDLAALVLLPAFSGGNAHKCWAEDQVV